MDKYYSVRYNPLRDFIEVLKWEKPKNGLIQTNQGQFFFDDYMVTASYPVIVSYNGSVRCGCPASRYRQGNCKHQYLINDFLTNRNKHEVMGYC